MEGRTKSLTLKLPTFGAYLADTANVTRVSRRIFQMYIEIEIVVSISLTVLALMELVVAEGQTGITSDHSRHSQSSRVNSHPIGPLIGFCNNALTRQSDAQLTQRDLNRSS